jgi:signal transduction histidine kinase
MGALIRSVDWAATPLGPVSAWPQSLRTAVSMMLESRFGTYIAWGPRYIQFYNDAYRPILGATKHPAVGKSAAETFAESWHIIGPMFDGVMRGEAVGSEDWMLPLDRYGYLEECYFTFCYSPIRAESGAVGGVLVTVTETTARVLGERRLRVLRDLSALAAKAKAAEEIFPDAARILEDDQGDVPFALFYAANAEGARLVAASGLGERAGAPPSTWPLGEVDGGRRMAVVDLAGHEPPLPGGPWPEPPRQAAVLAIAPPGHAPYGWVVVGISPRRALDDAYRDFLELLASNLASALANARALEEERRRAAALAEIDRAKTAFFSNVSHEFRTPLTLLLSPLEDEAADAARAGDEARAARLALMQRNGGRLLRLVNTLLDFSRIEAGRVDAVYEPVDLGTFTAELASVFRSAIERAGLALVVDCAPLRAPVHVDRDMWEKIVLNLLSNALKFTFEGRITVRLRAGDGTAVLEVEDTGVGIAAEELPRVFERFHRVRDTRARTHEGTGIGLALVQELAKLHAGTVSARSVLGAGTTFTVAIPTGTAHLPADRIGAARTLPSTATSTAAYVEEVLRWLPDASADRESLEAEPEAAAAGAERDVRILLADDNADMRDYLRRLLAPHWAVEAVADGREALRAARARPPDLVLADVMMPGLDGFQLLRRLRADPTTSVVPVILLSARAGDEATVEGLRAGADDYLVKPFSARELLARVRAHLALARARAAVAERARATAAEAEAAREQLATVLESITDGFFALDAAWRFTYINRRAAAVFGRLGKERDAMLGRSFWAEFPELRGLPVEAYYRRAMDEQVTVDFTDHYAPLDAWFDARLYPSRGGLSVYFRDVTERVAAERALRAQAEALEAAGRAKDEFLAMLSHELRTPLSAILGWARMLRSRALPPAEVERALASIERNAGLQTQLIDDLLDVSRIVAGKVTLEMEPLRVAAVVRNAVDAVQAAADAAGVRLLVSAGREDVWVRGDPARLQQVALNLLSNALKFTPRGGVVRIGIERTNGTVTVSVADTGRGIAADLLPHIFERFRQGDRDSRGGLGLGLAIVRHLVELHGGTVSAASPGEGQGATFTIRMPAVGAADPAPDAARAEAGDDRDAPALDGVRVLIVDDDADTRDLLTTILAMAGARVTPVASVQAARAVWAAQSFDLVLSDLSMPREDGYDLIRDLRAAGGPRVPAVVLSAYARGEDRARALAAGFDGYVSKPAEPEALLRVVRDALRRDGSTSVA